MEDSAATLRRGLDSATYVCSPAKDTTKGTDLLITAINLDV